MNPTGSWKVAAASVIGRHHESAGGRCEDAWAVARQTDTRHRKILALCVCDGAGSTTNGWRGAQLTSRFFVDWLSRNYAEITRKPAKAGVRVTSILQRLLRRAGRANGHSLKSFACTLVAVAVADDGTWIAFHIGDGAVVGCADGRWLPLSVPTKGEYANVTYFVTDDDAAESIQVHHSEAGSSCGVWSAFALFTDGVEAALINRRSGEIAPALSGIGNWLLTHPEEDVARAMEGQLMEVFRDRTGDDCSLAIVAQACDQSYVVPSIKAPDRLATESLT